MSTPHNQLQSDQTYSQTQGSADLTYICIRNYIFCCYAYKLIPTGNDQKIYKFCDSSRVPSRSLAFSGHYCEQRHWTVNDHS